MSEQYNKGRIGPIVKVISRLLQENPALHMGHEQLMAMVEDEIPELKDKETCANCDASMRQYEYNLDVIDTALVVGMANAVRRAVERGEEFTEANRVHVPTLPVSDAVRHRTTKCAKLGLVAKAINSKGRQIGGTWVVTRRGYAALRGERVPASVVTWRGQTIERTDKTTTFAEVKAGYMTREQDYYKKNGKNRSSEHGEDVLAYKMSDWVDFAGVHDGNIF